MMASFFLVFLCYCCEVLIKELAIVLLSEMSFPFTCLFRTGFLLFIFLFMISFTPVHSFLEFFF